MDKKKSIKSVVYFGVILVLVLVMLISGLRILESTVFSDKDDTGRPAASKTITRDGVDYFPRQDITVVLILGIDQFGEVKDSGSYNNSGAADMVSLLVFDNTNKKCDVLCLNRDTMLDMPVLGIGGKQAGTRFGQLALSHTYGNGLEDSCENTKKAVSDFLYGLHIDYYVAMNMDAIAILNDAVGGVTVNVTEDFSEVDPTITMGSFTLHGEQAIHFVRTRKDVGDQMNISRIQRQKDYMQGFLAAYRQTARDEQAVITAYDAVAPYIVTDCTVKTLTNLLNRYSDYQMGEMMIPEGENVMGDKYYEFYADEEKLDDLILRLFYAPKN